MRNDDKKTWDDHLQSNNSAVTENITGMIRRKIITSCEHEPLVKYEDFLDLQLHLQENQSPTVLQLIIDYFADENLYYKCEICKCPVPTMRKATMIRLPPVLILHLVRFNPDGESKKGNWVDLNMTLDSKVFAKEAIQHKLYKLSGVVNHSGNIKKRTLLGILS